MRRVLIIGIGVGDPDHVTMQAVKALNAADVLFIPDKGVEKQALRELRMAVCERFIERKTYRTVEFDVLPRDRSPIDYDAAVADWHAAIARQYSDLLLDNLADGECGAFLVWGDPTLYDSTLRIIETVRATERFALDYEVIPGISSVQVLAARHRVPLNRIGEPVLITTGRRLAAGFPDHLGSVVVMLDGEQAFKHTGRDDLDIHWGAYLGMADEVLVSGRLTDVTDEIVRIREAERQRHGWIMDAYLLRGPDGS